MIATVQSARRSPGSWQMRTSSQSHRLSRAAVVFGGFSLTTLRREVTVTRALVACALVLFQLAGSVCHCAAMVSHSHGSAAASHPHCEGHEQVAHTSSSGSAHSKHGDRSTDCCYCSPDTINRADPAPIVTCASVLAIAPGAAHDATPHVQVARTYVQAAIGPPILRRTCTLLI